MATRKKKKTTRPAPRRATKPVKKPVKKAAPKKPARAEKKPRARTQEQPRTQQQQSHNSGQQYQAPDYTQMFAQMGAPFLNMFQTTASTQSSDTQRMAQSWLDTQRQYWQTALENLQATPATPGVWPAFTPHPTAPHFSAFMGMSGGAAGPGSAFADMMRGSGRAFDPLDQLASLPGLGYLREKHEEFARLYKAWQAHEAAQQKYNAEMLRIMLEALARFETSIAAPDKPFTSLKDVYAHWVNISEDVYARFAASPAHTAIYGEVVNTLSAVKRELSVVVDQWAAQMNLPTRAEVDSLHQRMHDMKRELREIKRVATAKKGGRA